MTLTKTFPSRSRPGVTYTARLTPDGRVACDCPGYARHRKTLGATALCWHLRELHGERDRENPAARCMGFRRRRR